jgi:FKBP-type peptidyl-prolyl cis-trans isomerase FkpA
MTASSPPTAIVLACACAALAVLAGCSASPTSPTPAPGFGITDIRPGTGAQAESGRQLTLDFTLWLYDESHPEGKGLVLDTSRAGDPFVFTLGTGAVIAGWEQGLPGMRAGGLRRLVVPPSLGYGETRRDIVPPYATLVFEIELLSVDDPGN